MFDMWDSPRKQPTIGELQTEIDRLNMIIRDLEARLS